MTTNTPLGALTVTRKTGDERFLVNAGPAGFDLLRFWQWACSDLANNAMRGVLAEFIVAQALGVADGTRVEWNAYDLTTRNGLKVEVKSAAYLQSWHQTKHSSITFSICPTTGWDATDGDRSLQRSLQRGSYATSAGFGSIMGCPRLGAILVLPEVRVPRIARYRRAPGSLEPGRTYHAMNRGVDRCDIFHSDLDRVLYLSMLADACQQNGVVCHAWCLMTSHFHAVLEDPRGMLSQTLHSVQSVYAQYFNSTRPRRRTGPLFEGRFRAELIDSPQYFEDACAYVLLNPLEPKVPLATSAEAYRWSSAAMVCSECTPAESVAALLEPMGGVDGVYNRLRPSARKSSLENRRRRLEALASGEWLERDHVLAGRSPEQYRQMLAERAARRNASKARAQPEPILLAEARKKTHPATIASRPAFAGERLSTIIDELRVSCEATLPPEISLSEFLLYQAYRFTSATVEELANRWKLTVDGVHSILDRMRERRLLTTAWERILWRLEWGLRWRLRFSPLRA